MKSLELMPSKDNLIMTIKQDIIERNKDLCRFINLLNSIEDNCSIALDGAWGSGKTFFVQHTKMILDAHNSLSVNDYKAEDNTEIRRIYQPWSQQLHGDSEESEEIEPHVSVYYDAWSNDNDVDPILSLVHGILQSVDIENPLKESSSSIRIAAEIINFFTGINIKPVADAIKDTDILASINKQKNIHTLISDFLRTLLEERGNRLVIFVDELDRCKPSYTIQLLERIKHYFSNTSITFVFSINTNELLHTIKQYYGEGFNSSKYLDRFFDLKLSLPPINRAKFLNHVGFSDTGNFYDATSLLVIKHFNFEMREITKFVRLTQIACYKASRNNHSHMSSEEIGRFFCLSCLTPIIIGLKIDDTSRFSNFINGRDSSPLIDILGSGDYVSYFFEKMLDRDEYYFDDSSGNAITIVNYEDKLNEIYDALFVYKYEGLNYDKYIGRIAFDKSSRTYLLRIVSLLSDFSDYT